MQQIWVLLNKIWEQQEQKSANEFGAPQVTLARNVRFANASFKA